VKPGRRVVDQGSEEGLTIEKAQERLSSLRDAVQAGQTARINLGWVIEEGGDA
jgi:hypothetical protein